MKAYIFSLLSILSITLSATAKDEGGTSSQRHQVGFFPEIFVMEESAPDIDVHSPLLLQGWGWEYKYLNKHVYFDLSMAAAIDFQSITLRQGSLSIGSPIKVGNLQWIPFWEIGGYFLDDDFEDAFSTNFHTSLGLQIQYDVTENFQLGPKLSLIRTLGATLGSAYQQIGGKIAFPLSWRLGDLGKGYFTFSPYYMATSFHPIQKTIMYGAQLTFDFRF